MEPKGLAELGAPLFKEGSIVLFIALADRSGSALSVTMGHIDDWITRSHVRATA
jgi:hypothetical protein